MERGECDGCGMVDRDLSESRLCVKCVTWEAAKLARALDAAAQAKATASRGQIAAMVMAGFAASPFDVGTPKNAAESAVVWADALLAELAKPKAQISRERVAKALTRELAKPTEASR